MSTSTTHNTTTNNNAGFPPAPGETHQETSCECNPANNDDVDRCECLMFLLDPDNLPPLRHLITATQYPNKH